MLSKWITFIQKFDFLIKHKVRKKLTKWLMQLVESIRYPVPQVILKSIDKPN